MFRLSPVSGSGSVFFAHYDASTSRLWYSNDSYFATSTLTLATSSIFFGTTDPVYVGGYVIGFALTLSILFYLLFLAWRRK